MKKQYEHINTDERDKIAVFKANGFNFSDIARMLGRNRSTITREIRRNGGQQRDVYTSMRAQSRAEARKSQANTHERLKNSLIREYVTAKLKEKWTPEIIAGRFKKEHPGESISHEAIYQYIYFEAPELKKHLPRSHRTRKKRGYQRTNSVNRIPSRISIDKRPQEANDRCEFGHWEADTAVSRQSKQALAILLERASRLTKLRKIERNGAQEFSSAVIQTLRPLDEQKRKTITYDNGKENMSHQRINEKLNMDSYFCNPYHSWEKGSVENTVGLVRRYLPKKTDFAKVSDIQIADIEHQLNSRPRKCLQFRTPYEVFSHDRVALHG